MNENGAFSYFSESASFGFRISKPRPKISKFQNSTSKLNYKFSSYRFILSRRQYYDPREYPASSPSHEHISSMRKKLKLHFSKTKNSIFTIFVFRRFFELQESYGAETLTRDGSRPPRHFLLCMCHPILAKTFD